MKTHLQHMDQIRISPFCPENQAEVKALILAGLAEYWGVIDPALNPDLNDISARFSDGVFLVAWKGRQIVGTGGLLRRGSGVGEIVRMSVAADCRRRGIGVLILDALCAAARQLGLQRLILETNTDWAGAVAFYQTYGFRVTHEVKGPFGMETYFELDLNSSTRGRKP